jgi:hypothetical protein
MSAFLQGHGLVNNAYFWRLYEKDILRLVLGRFDLDFLQGGE